MSAGSTLLLLLRGSGAPAELPLDTQDAILAKAAASPALVAAMPGGLSPLQPGKAPLPYATMTHVGGAYTHHAGDEGLHTREDQFLITILGQKKDLIEEAKDALTAVFNHLSIGAAPLPIRRGKVYSVMLTSEYMDPGAKPEAGNRPVYRQVLRFTAWTERTLA